MSLSIRNGTHLVTESSNGRGLAIAKALAGQIDILVNSAGIRYVVSLEALRLDQGGAILAAQLGWTAH